MYCWKIVENSHPIKDCDNGDDEDGSNILCRKQENIDPTKCFGDRIYANKVQTEEKCFDFNEHKEKYFMKILNTDDYTLEHGSAASVQCIKVNSINQIMKSMTI